eukprot:scaffold539725_cov17-Prasinocladus_malaysianus.AAC.1
MLDMAEIRFQSTPYGMLVSLPVWIRVSYGRSMSIRNPQQPGRSECVWAEPQAGGQGATYRTDCSRWLIGRNSR